MRSVVGFVGMLGLVACGLTTDGVTDDTDAADSCGDAAPEFGEITLADLGTRTVGGEDRRVIAIQAPATDADGDLHTYTAKLWYDTFEDGEVATNFNAEVTAEVSDRACEVPSADVGIAVPLGDDVPFDAQVEFGLVVEDAAGNAANGGVPVIVVFRTPEM